MAWMQVTHKVVVMEINIAMLLECRKVIILDCHRQKLRAQHSQHESLGTRGGHETEKLCFVSFCVLPCSIAFRFG